MKLLKRLPIILVLIAMIFAFKARTEETNISYQQESYIVQKGDTLWEIAEEYAKENMQEYIYKIEQLNNIDSDLIPGQEIIIYK